MAYAHARGVIHRDLKPSNVMVGSFGEVQVMDWGLAKVLPRGGAIDDASAGHTRDEGTIIATARSGTETDLSQAGSVMGTPSYMAPEQARGEIDQVDERADVFALGSIFCEILTGEPAFTGRNSGEIQRKAARGDLTGVFAKLDENNFSYDFELINLAKACLAPEPNDRPRNASEVADRMSLYHSRVQDRLRQSEIERAEEKARAEEATKRAAVERDRRRLTMALAASIVGMMMLGGGGWAYLERQKAVRKAATERGVTEALDNVKLIWGKARGAAISNLTAWTEAVSAAETAKKLLAATIEADPSFRDRVVTLVNGVKAEQKAAVERSIEADRDTALIERLESARRVDIKSSIDIDKFYATAFREFGIDLDQLDPTEAGQRLAKRLKAKELSYYLDDWAIFRAERDPELVMMGDIVQDRGKALDKRVKRVVDVAVVADPDPWRNQLGVTRRALCCILPI